METDGGGDPVNRQHSQEIHLQVPQEQQTIKTIDPDASVKNFREDEEA